jgi:hypothetical protein
VIATSNTCGVATQGPKQWFVWDCHERNESASTSETDAAASTAEPLPTSPSTTSPHSSQANGTTETTSSPPVAEAATADAAED